MTRAEYDPEVDGETDEADLPATFLDRDEAASWAAARDLRLPTWNEWRHLARAGSSGEPSDFPWGDIERPGYANTLDLAVHRALPAGVFESGRTNLGAYDVIGNVWEWLADVPPLDQGEQDRLRDTGSPVVGGLPDGAAAGGSYASSTGRVRQERRGLESVRRIDARSRFDDVGFRVVGDARAWMRLHGFPLWRDAPPSGRAWLEEALARWDPTWSAALADQLLEDGVDPAFCAVLRRGVEGATP